MDELKDRISKMSVDDFNGELPDLGEGLSFEKIMQEGDLEQTDFQLDLSLD